MRCSSVRHVPDHQVLTIACSVFCSDIETLKTISAACAKNNVVAGMYFQPPGLEPATLIEMGYRFFVTSPLGQLGLWTVLPI